MKEIKVIHVTGPNASDWNPKFIEPTLKNLQECVGGYIEHVRISPTIEMLVNEDGISLDLPVTAVMGGTRIRGNFLLLGPVRRGQFTSIKDTNSVWEMALMSLYGHPQKSVRYRIGKGEAK